MIFHPPYYVCVIIKLLLFFKSSFIISLANHIDFVISESNLIAHLIQKPHQRLQLYRRYRHGDFPDLLINNLALLLPLQALAQYDKQLAGNLFVAIFNSTVTELGASSKPFLISTADYIQRIFGQTKHCDPVVFSTLMELALVHPTHFDFPVDLVGSLAISNQNLALAICYLERRLHIDWETDGPPTTTKSNDISNIQIEHQHWLKLIDLYRALAENDVVSGIFADKLNMVGKIPAAISLELDGDLEQAAQLFREVNVYNVIVAVIYLKNVEMFRL